MKPKSSSTSAGSNVGRLFGKLGQNTRYMNKARESLGDVATMISKDTLTKIARTIKDNERAQKYYTTGHSELRDMAGDIVKGKAVKVAAPTSERYINSKGGKSPYTKGEYSIDKDDNKKKEVNIQSTAVDKASFDPKTGIAAVKFKGGNKWYDYVMTSEQFDEFMKAPSKGRYVTKVMRPRNWLPGYVPRRKR